MMPVNKYMLCDAQYDSKGDFNALLFEKYVPIIAVNKRKTKNPRELTKYEAKIYKKRVRIEHTNNIFKYNRRCLCRFDRNVDTFIGSIYVSMIDLILRKI